jgi:hypothetical protein
MVWRIDLAVSLPHLCYYAFVLPVDRFQNNEQGRGGASPTASLSYSFDSGRSWNAPTSIPANPVFPLIQYSR